MPKHRILLVEELVLSDSAEFLVDGDTPASAAALLIKARQDGLDADTDIVELPDGQRAAIAPEQVVRSRVFCVLLDEHGDQIGEIEPDDPALRAKRAPPPTTPLRLGKPNYDPQWVYDPREWEGTYAWQDRSTLPEAADLAFGAVREFATLMEGPPVFAARVPVAFNEDGYPEETEIGWFHSLSQAHTAVALAWGKSPNPEYAIPTHSPWGKIETLRFIAPGIYGATTASHGGLHLSPTLNADMPHDMRSRTGWYDEDCRWSLVALKYSDPFKAEIGNDPGRPLKTTYDLALECARYWYPDIVARFLEAEASHDRVS